MEKINRKEHLFIYKHRCRWLCAVEKMLIVLQLIGMSVCAAYVLVNFVNYTLPDTRIGTEHFSFLFKAEYMNVLCILLSFLLLISRPTKLRDQIDTLKLAIEFLEETNEDEKGTTFHKLIIEDADKFITEIDTYVWKKKKEKDNENREQIEPHEKRMFLRHWLIITGIPLMVVLTGVMVFILGFNIPTVAAIDILIGYTLVIFEACYYKIILRKAGIDVFSLKYLELVSNSTKKKQEFKCYQKICYMRMDRLSNYGLVLGVASAATNMIAIFITILDTTKSINFQSLFVLENKSLNVIVSLIFTGASFVLFFADLYLQNRNASEIRKLRELSNMPYSANNFEYLKKFIQKFDQNIFSRDALDLARGVYDYNNDFLVEHCIKQKSIGIPVNCMFTVEKAFPGRLPRYKLTILILWLCGFCIWVWGKTQFTSLVDITIAAFILYDFIVLGNGIWLWRQKKEWIALERNYDKSKHTTWALYRNVVQDFIENFLLHATFVLALLCFKIKIKNPAVSYRTIFLLTGIVAIYIVFKIVKSICQNCTDGFFVWRKNQYMQTFTILMKEKLLIADSTIFKYTWVLIVAILGIIQNVVQYFSMGKLNGLHHLITNCFIVPWLIASIVKYYQKEIYINNKTEGTIHASTIILLITWSEIFLLPYWYLYPRKSFADESLLCNVIFEIVSIVLIAMMAIRIISIWGVQAQKDSESRKLIKWFPYNFFASFGIFLIIWGLMVFLYSDAIEYSYYITVFLYVFCMWIDTIWIKRQVNLILSKRHKVFLISTTSIIFVFVIAVALKCCFASNFKML